MGLLSGKKILLGISGGIAAYKTPFLVRQIVQHGAEVKVVMTPSAKEFVTPLTLATLSKNPVLSTFTATDLDNPVWNDHVELALWADLMLIAPATSNTLSSMVQGRCNNLLLAAYLSSKCPVFVAPAMDLDMYSHPSNKRNLEALVSYGTNVLPVGEGFLASGLEGKGRMMEPEEIVSKIVDFFYPSLPLKGKKVLITAGPTYEAIDPVRFIGNHASGKMGFALAEVAAQHGAEVILISGPTHEKINHPSILLEKVISAEEMFTSVKKHYPEVAIAIAAAAVADFKPKNSAKQKIKKQQGLESIPMIPTVDILAYLGEHKSGQFLLGFALETENELENAKNKLTQKNLDGIVLNSLRDAESGFTVSTNKITYIDANNTVKEFPLQSKLDCAKTIFGQILKP
ncbi:MAG: bifunctional phosphopantothenoylcysteine decarboxylase/phosphopantothenate--cysteine ligase CoaBC [Bacteroidetes bacterium]|nr:bifunctional phosphopantothenoylcysteine decarboxylase/phosphopantothenate--cysteine ligase CoaBC [Bacteroidota bacterium]MDA0984831.1 bifunctional phosphopantothenoylcysteine decarboxylase/phosphopantothenate--cysteine ligase CoaBC [Bacteroidota bacterium]